MIALRDQFPLKQLDRQAKQTLRFMTRHGLVMPIEGARDFYVVTAPFVGSREVNPYELAIEAHYDGALAFSTALELHQLTDQRFRTLHVLAPASRDDDARPLDTAGRELELALLFTPARLVAFDGYSIALHRAKEAWWFGHTLIRPMGFSIRVTDLERTLLDGLRYPKHCGGLDEVFRAWVRARDVFDVEILIAYAERFGIGILFQRLGFVLETLGVQHSRLDAWSALHAQRGGSRVLDPEAPFSGQRFDARWALSINHPPSILETMDASYS